MFNKYIADVPEYEWHWSSWLCDFLFSVVPGISVPINATSAVSVDIDSLSTDDKASMVILESNWIGVVSPVREIIRHLQNSQYLSYIQLVIRYLEIYHIPSTCLSIQQ